MRNFNFHLQLLFILDIFRNSPKCVKYNIFDNLSKIITTLKKVQHMIFYALTMYRNKEQNHEPI